MRRVDEAEDGEERRKNDDVSIGISTATATYTHI
jgi:hypothetical protein